MAEAVQATAVPAGGSVTAVEAVPYQPGVQVRFASSSSSTSALPVLLFTTTTSPQAVRINGFGAQQDLSVGPVASQSDLAYAEEVNFESCALFVDRNQLSHLPLSNWCVFSQILRARAWVSCFAMIDVFLIFVSILSRLGYWGLLLIFGPVNAHRFTGQP